MLESSAGNRFEQAKAGWTRRRVSPAEAEFQPAPGTDPG